MKFFDKISSYVLVTHHKQNTSAKISLMLYYIAAAFCAIGAFVTTILLIIR